MTLVHWNPNLSVGSDEIDADHGILIDLLNSLAASLEAGSGPKVVSDALDKLVAETESHFRREEQIMERESYPELEYHRRIHEALLKEIRQFREELEGGSEIGPEVTEFIRNWLISHIMESDKQLGGYLQGLAAGRSGQANSSA